MEKEKLIDLHTHTNYSDGEYSPNELVNMAIEKNIGVLAITDHDSVLGLKNLNRNDSSIIQSGIRVINGIELSAKREKGRMHILGLGIDPYNEQLNNKMNELRDNSLNYVLSLMEQIKRDYDIRFKYDDIRDLINSNHNLGRPDLAKLCVKYGYATTVQEAFYKYLIPAYDKIGKYKKGIHYEECLNLINESGGIPVLAHPKSLELNEKEFLILLKKMISAGLKGIEVYHSTHTNEEMEYYLNVCNEYYLLVSGGSDYHGPLIKPDVQLGMSTYNIKSRSLTVLNYIR